MEEFLGRSLKTTEIVHHINHNRHDNRIENLMITNRAEHCKIHCPGKNKRTHVPRWRNKDGHFTTKETGLYLR